MSESGRLPTWGAPSVQLNRLQAAPLDLLALRRRARLALGINLVLAICFLGLLCIPGAVFAALALRALPGDVPRAARMLRWSWGLLAANLLFYLLLAVMVAVYAVYLIFAATH